MVLCQRFGASLLLLALGAVASFCGCWILALVLGATAFLAPVATMILRHGTTHPAVRFLLPLAGGIAFGLFWADAIFWNPTGAVMSWIERTPLVEMCAQAVNFPAIGTFFLLVGMGLGPHGDAGWNMAPWCIIAQWTLLGGGVGCWLSVRQGHNDRDGRMNDE